MRSCHCKTDKAYILSCYAYVKEIVCKLVLSKPCGSVEWVCLARDRNSEHGAAIVHYILQKKSSLFWSFFCFSDFVCYNEANLHSSYYQFLCYIKWF